MCRQPLLNRSAADSKCDAKVFSATCYFTDVMALDRLVFLPPPPTPPARACLFGRKPVLALLPFNNPAIEDSYFLSAGEEGSMICWKVHKLTDPSGA